MKKIKNVPEIEAQKELASLVKKMEKQELETLIDEPIAKCKDCDKQFPVSQIKKCPKCLEKVCPLCLKLHEEEHLQEEYDYEEEEERTNNPEWR